MTMTYVWAKVKSKDVFVALDSSSHSDIKKHIANQNNVEPTHVSIRKTSYSNYKPHWYKN